MDTEIQTFEFVNDKVSCQVRAVEINSEPWFVGNDVSMILGYSNYRNAVANHVDDEDKLRTQIEYAGQKREVTVVNESGLYSLILSSKLPTAKKFKRWVTSDVLPTIRKHGAYATPETIESILANPDNGIKLLQALKDERSQKEQALLEASKEREARAIAEQKLSEAKPKLDYVDKILESKKTILTTHLATDYGCSAVAFNRMLCDKKIQRKLRNTYVLYSQYQGHGWTHTFARTIKTNHGQEIKEQMEWTQKGNIGLYELLKDRFGLLPEIERDYSKPYKIVTTKGKIEEVA